MRFVSFREGSKNEGCPVGYARCLGGVLKGLEIFLGEFQWEEQRSSWMSFVMNFCCDLLNYNTLSETNSKSTWKWMVGSWKTTFLLGPGLFLGAFADSFRVGGFLILRIKLIEFSLRFSQRKMCVFWRVASLTLGFAKPGCSGKDGDQRRSSKEEIPMGFPEFMKPSLA